jgi:hypothetical protein
VEIYIVLAKEDSCHIAFNLFKVLQGLCLVECVYPYSKRHLTRIVSSQCFNPVIYMYTKKTTANWTHE